MYYDLAVSDDGTLMAEISGWFDVIIKKLPMKGAMV
jgi:hypothetical protein